MMQLNDYVPLAVRTESKIDNVVFNLAQFHRLMYLSIHITKLMDIVKKNVYYGKPINPVDWRELAINIKVSSQILATSDINDNPQPIPNLDSRLFHSAVGIFTEAGEMLSALESDAPVDTINFKEELFDAMWYIAIGCDSLGISAEQGLQNNIDKLSKRYPEKFDATRAIHRDLVEERKILENGDVSK